MGVVRAKIQTVADIYQLLRTAWLANGLFKSPMTAGIDGSVRTGWVGIPKDNCACCANQCAGQSSSGLQPAGSPANWRCIAVEKLSRVQLLEDAWRSA